jgi:hypothetical protein
MRLERFIMEQINFEGTSNNALLSIDDVEIIQEKEDSNDSICLSDDNDQISFQQEEIINSNRSKTNISINYSSNNKARTSDQTPLKSLKKQDRRYVSSWEKLPESFYRTYTFDAKGNRQEKRFCWLYTKKNEDNKVTMRCKLCETYKTTNSNGKTNLWATSGYELMKVSKVKEHHHNEAHKIAQNHELQTASRSQPTWLETQIKERSKYEESIQNLILLAIHVCQQDQSLNSYQNLCTLVEAVGVKLLTAELGGISYRNDNAALEFLRHAASCLHQEVIEKVNKSPSIGKKKFTI